MKRDEVVQRTLGCRLLGVVLEYMQKAGMSAAEIKGEVQRQTSPNAQAFKSFLSGAGQVMDRKPVEVVADVLRAWHRNARFMTDEAMPKPLTLRQGSDSIAELTRSVSRDLDANEVIRALKDSGGLRRHGKLKYLPVNQHYKFDTKVRIDNLDYLVDAVAKFISTINRNTTKEYADRTLLERCATVADLDSRELKAFNEYTHEKSLGFLLAIDDWLEKRNVSGLGSKKGKRAVKRGVPAGVHVFAYLGDTEKPKPRRKTAPMKKK
jgi:hypothetical protein